MSKDLNEMSKDEIAEYQKLALSKSMAQLIKMYQATDKLGKYESLDSLVTEIEEKTAKLAKLREEITAAEYKLKGLRIDTKHAVHLKKLSGQVRALSIKLEDVDDLLYVTGFTSEDD